MTRSTKTPKTIDESLAGVEPEKRAARELGAKAGEGAHRFGRVNPGRGGAKG